MNLIVGLGNPGDKYLKSRHNAGFILLDEIVGGSWEKDKYAESLTSLVGNSLFVKPQTFMNNSGSAVKYLASKNNIDSKDITIIHDDIDLPFGSRKIVFGSGAGGHNGIKSVIDNLGNNNFVRIKIGIAPTDTEGRAIKPKAGIFQSQKSAVGKYVLKDFSVSDLEKLKNIAKELKEILDVLSRDGYLTAMNKFN